MQWSIIRNSGDPSFGQRAAVIVVSCIGLIASTIFLFLFNQLPHHQHDAAKPVDHTLAVLNSATRLDTDFSMVIAEARGFMLNNSGDSRTRFDAAARQLSDDIVKLRVLTADSPAEQSALDRIEPMIATRADMLREIIRGQRTGNDVTGSSNITARQADQASTEKIFAAVEDFKAKEQHLLDERRAAARLVVRLWLGIALGCGVLAAGSGILVAALLMASTRESEHLVELRRLNAGLEERVRSRNATLAARETGYRLLAEHLEASEERYRLLAESTNDVIICAQLDLRRTYASPACRAIFGYEPAEMLDDETATIHPDDAAAFSEAVHPLIVGAADRTLVTYRAQHKHGHWIWIEETISLVRDQATRRPVSLVCSLRDISERHNHADELSRVNATLEQLASHLVAARDVAERASRAKSRFLEGMSHELRTPLNGILGYAQLLGIEGGLNVAQTARLDAMLSAGRHLMEMIHCVLDLSEIETEHFELQITNVDPRRLVGACLELVRPAAEAKGLDFRLFIAADVPQNIKADPTRLRQVLLNLLGNAVKLTAQRVVEMRILTTAGGAELRFEVADNGPGPSTERSQSLLPEIERLDIGAARSVEAGELGLQISARLAGLMGGRIGHDGDPAGGSVLWLELPLASRILAEPGLDAAAGPDMPNAEAVQAPRRVLRVLVVDDVLMNRDIASSFLRAAGHEVTCANGGAEAVAAVATTDFDVVLMDVRMPEMDGLEATRRIRALEGARARVPIVALTAQAFANQVAECRTAGMDSHLPKPFDRDMLLAAVVRAAMAGSPPNQGISPVPMAIAAVAAPAAPVIGLDLPVLNPTTFERTAVFLAPEAIATHLRTITNLSEALLHDLQEPDALTRTGEQLAEAAHALAGSAGMFGFERLSTLARRFEPAVQSGSMEAAALGVSLSAALEATLEELHARTAQVAVA